MGHHRCGQEVDETTEDRRLDRPGDCLPAVARPLDLYRSGWTLPDDRPDSLRRAVEELKRIL